MKSTSTILRAHTRHLRLDLLDRPQAHRPAVPHVDIHLLPGGHDASASPCGSSSSLRARTHHGPDLQRPVHAPRRDHDLPLHHPRHPGRASATSCSRSRSAPRTWPSRGSTCCPGGSTSPAPSWCSPRSSPAAARRTRAGPSTCPTASGPGTNVSLAVFGVFVLGFSSMLTGLNFITTIHRLRAPGMTWFRMPLFTWSLYATAWVQILATPIIAITLLLIIVERLFGVGLLRPGQGRRPDPVPAPVLDLFPPGGLHHDPAGHGRGLRDHPRLLAQEPSSGTRPSPSRASPSRCSATWSGATTCSPAA